jgi:hypothetical protein
MQGEKVSGVNRILTNNEYIAAIDNGGPEMAGIRTVKAGRQTPAKDSRTEERWDPVHGD